jgi:hypothetical protein
MPEPGVIEKFERRMIVLGCPGRKIKRAVHELDGHYSDLKAAALGQGLSDSAADDRAAALLGEPIGLAEKAAAGLRHSSWWGRHRVVGFCILGPLGFGLAWLLCVFLFGFIFWVIEFAAGRSAEAWVPATMAHLSQVPALLPLLQTLINASVIGFFAAFLCWLARRSAAGTKWAVLACAGCAVHGWFFHFILTAHLLMITYRWQPNWVCLLTPLLVAGGFLFTQGQRERRRTGALPFALLFPGLLSGCAAPREQPASRRGWIGGDYKLACRENFWNAVSPSPAVASGLPRELGSKLKSAIVFTGLRTNTPASRAGLQQKDYILEVNHQPVIRLRDFRRTIDQCKPGTTVTIRAYRDGKELDLPVLIGEETFRKGGTFSIVFPSVVHRWDLCLNPGVSFVIAGYEANPGLRHEMRNSREVFDEDWKAFAGIFELTKGKRVIAQKLAGSD